MKKKICSIFLALATLISLAACNGGTAEQSAAPSEQSAGESSDPTASGDAQVGESSFAAYLASAQKDVINVGIEADVSDFNPWTYTGVGANAAIWSLYQPLLNQVGDMYYPAIMKSYSIADDGLSMDGEIFDYVYDWEGNHLTADDVLFSLEKSVEYYPEVGDQIEEVIKTGEYTFTIVFPRTLYVGEFDNIARSRIVSQAAYEGSADEMHTSPVGTGPYKLTQYTSGYMFTYEKLEDWWQTDESQIHPRDMSNVDTINWYVISESAQRTIALEQGTIDVCSSISADDQEKFDGQNGYWLTSVPDNLSMTLFPNCDVSSPCNDLNLRLAICYAISNQAVLDSVYGGRGTVNTEFTPNWAVGINEEWAEEDNYYHLDMEKAAEYLAQSDYNGETLTIICATDEKSTNTAQLIQNFILQIGIKSEVTSYESSVFNQYIKEADMWDIMLKTTATSTYYSQGVHSSFSQTRQAWGGSINFIYDDQLQELIDTCMSPTHTTEDLEALHRYFIDNCYVMGLVNPVICSVVPDWISDVTLSIRKTIIPGGCIYE